MDSSPLDKEDLIEFMTVYDNKEVDNDEVKSEIQILTADLIRKRAKNFYKIIDLREGGFCYHAIRARVQRSSFTVMRAWKQWTYEHRTARKPVSVRLEGVLISASSICRRLLHRGLRAKVPLYMSPLTVNHRRLRMQWAHQPRAWQANWHQVVFSDESRFNLWVHDGHIPVRRYAGERCLPDCGIERHSGLTPRIILWGELINRSGESSTQEIRQLLSGEELGSRRPSELLKNMTRRAETFNVPEKLMLELFLQRLPSRVQSILAAVSDLTLAKAAEISDRIFEVTPTPVETYAISGTSATTTEDRLFREIEKLNKRIDSLSFSRSRSPYRDRISNVSFLVDTGSDVSLLPALEYHKRHPPQLTLFAANSSTINVYGQKTLSLDLNVRREFIWTFLLASVKTPILGDDFLHYFELVPDLRQKCLRDLKTKLQTTGHIKQAALHSVKTISSHETLYHDLLKSYPSITR
ncbi:transposon Ty3-G Gag-Pol polyprotein [Trichonephila clavipes]|nr:transposon Ty3-G Gag-Pol polyprotein [Trichonephila clavipes]